MIHSSAFMACLLGQTRLTTIVRAMMVVAILTPSIVCHSDCWSSCGDAFLTHIILGFWKTKKRDVRTNRIAHQYQQESRYIFFDMYHVEQQDKVSSKRATCENAPTLHFINSGGRVLLVCSTMHWQSQMARPSLSRQLTIWQATA